MGENFKIGQHNIKTKEEYMEMMQDVLKTGKDVKSLKTLNGAKISEDDLVILESIADELEKLEAKEVKETKENKNTTNAKTQNNQEKSKEEKIKEVEEKYYKQIRSLEEHLDALEEQRRQIYQMQLGKAENADAIQELISNANNITNQMNTIRSQVSALLDSMDSQITKIEESASKINENNEYVINSAENINPNAEILEKSSAKFDTSNFKPKLTAQQANDLNTFKAHWNKNKNRYAAVAKQTGVPAQLIAAIHWREASGNFNARLHDGGSLSGFSSWEASAIDALKGNYGNIDKNNVQTWLNFAEHYNGMGYANKGLPSPYVWAGTTNYTSGKYVADGVFDGSYVDKQLGVAVMLQAIL